MELTPSKLRWAGWLVWASFGIFFATLIVMAMNALDAGMGPKNLRLFSLEENVYVLIFQMLVLTLITLYNLFILMELISGWLSYRPIRPIVWSLMVFNVIRGTLLTVFILYPSAIQQSSYLSVTVLIDGALSIVLGRLILKMPNEFFGCRKSVGRLGLTYGICMFIGGIFDTVFHLDFIYFTGTFIGILMFLAFVIMIAHMFFLAARTIETARAAPDVNALVS